MIVWLEQGSLAQCLHGSGKLSTYVMVTSPKGPVKAAAVDPIEECVCAECANRTAQWPGLSWGGCRAHCTEREAAGNAMGRGLAPPCVT